MKHRMYVDEVGNSDLNASDDPNHRYLSLTCVITSLAHIQNIIHPRMEKLKADFFNSHPDDPLILHRKELVNQKPPFQALKDPEVANRFNDELLALLRESQFTVLTVVIDKKEHRDRYNTWRYDPYHYCLAVVLERYVKWLEKHGVPGDVLAESRGGKADMRLKESFHGVYKNGTDYIDAQRFQNSLTSSQLKVKSKSNNIAGLQLADLIAHPSYKAVLARKEKKELAKNFGGTIATILEASKYDRSLSGSIEGWGTKWLP